MKNTLLFSTLLLLISGCAAPYNHIEPGYMEYHKPPEKLDNCGDNIEITYRYNVFDKTNNRRYSRKEKQLEVCLLAIRIDNRGDDTLFIPDDLVIEARENVVFPLGMDETIDLFLQDYNLNFESLNYVDFQVGGNWAWIIPAGISVVDMVNTTSKIKANNRFINEMLDYYLVDSSIPPGAVVSGLLALPVPSDTPLSFRKK